MHRNNTELPLLIEHVSAFFIQVDSYYVNSQLLLFNIIYRIYHILLVICYVTFHVL